MCGSTDNDDYILDSLIAFMDDYGGNNSKKAAETKDEEKNIPIIPPTGSNSNGTEKKDDSMVSPAPNSADSSGSGVSTTTTTTTTPQPENPPAPKPENPPAPKPENPPAPKPENPPAPKPENPPAPKPKNPPAPNSADSSGSGVSTTTTTTTTPQPENPPVPNSADSSGSGVPTTTTSPQATMSRKRQLEYKFVFKADQNAEAAIASAEEVRSAPSNGDKDEELKKIDLKDPKTLKDRDLWKDVMKHAANITDTGSKIAGQSGLSYQSGTSDDDKEKKKKLDSDLGVSKSTLAAGSNVFNMILHGIEAYEHKEKADKAKLTGVADSKYAEGAASLLELGAEASDMITNITEAVESGVEGFKPASGVFKTMFGFSSAGFKGAGNISKIYGRARQKNAHSKIANADTFNDQANENALKDERKAMKRLSNRDDSQLSDDQKTALKKRIASHRDTRRTVKAKKYAMHQASRLHKIQSESISKEGTAALVFDTLGNAASMVKSFENLPFLGEGTTNWLGAGAGLFSTLFKGISSGLGIHEKSDFAKNGEKRLKNEKNQIVREYLDENIQSIKNKSGAWNPNQNERANLARVDTDDEKSDTTLGDKEAKRLVLMKLGFYVRTNSQADSVPFDEIFKKITEKRANQILHAEPAEKTAMLNSLGFPQSVHSKVDIDDLIKVLSGETV